MITPIDKAQHACYGIMCDRHSTCLRYAMVEQTSTDHTIATCDNGLGDKPLFLAMETEKKEGETA
ncbi:hypothetical protein DBR47_14530 [Paucibacter sp. KBW04]|uniref:hypothetical protein n=1 Tax=Paucibacter sp. KBW04 TaxID=2153361 RepID=UPI000F55B77B|nr:hypothetical protein [Paucibacter sp. KBW04]RQO58005.1 hypothetical protein DBR47_14530 [Paucibacter sp. KBW04]